MKGTDLRAHRDVAIWLYVGVGMLIIQVLLGGITRLTGSGLSITEWQPILGFLPPMNETAWIEAFERYKQIGQFKHLNSHFTLSDFKEIYFWEWFHREWARLIGLVFIIPFIFFLIKGKIKREMLHPLIILFLLGASQGMIGWIMVKSGLNLESLYVSHVSLAIHFVAAMILLAYLFWFALKVSISEGARSSASGLVKLNIALLIPVFLQLCYGAFMAGSHAALVAPTWPTINGYWLPDVSFEKGVGSSLIQNLLVVQFIHRNLAYLITGLIIVWTFKTRELAKDSLLYRIRFLPLAMVIVQVILGVIALINVLNSNNLLFNILHQLFGMLLMLVLFFCFYLSRDKKKVKIFANIPQKA